MFEGGIQALQAAVFALPSFRHMDDLILFNGLALHSGQILQLLEEDLDGDDGKVGSPNKAATCLSEASLLLPSSQRH